MDHIVTETVEKPALGGRDEWWFRRYLTMYAFRILIKNDIKSGFISPDIQTSLMRNGNTLEGMSDEEFEGHKRSVLNHLQKPMDEDSSECHYFDFRQGDVAHIERLTKPEIVGFFNQYLNPTPEHIARLSEEDFFYCANCTGEQVPPKDFRSLDNSKP